jgi:hypothetical protein
VKLLGFGFEEILFLLRNLSRCAGLLLLTISIELRKCDYLLYVLRASVWLRRSPSVLK